MAAGFSKLPALQCTWLIHKYHYCNKLFYREWQFLHPEYMVHQPHGSTTTVNEPGAAREGVPMRGAPYATEQQSQFNRDGHSMTDKTVKLPEARPHGYGVRTCKPPPKGPKAVDKTKPLSSQVQGERPRLKYQPL